MYKVYSGQARFLTGKSMLAYTVLDLRSNIKPDAESILINII